MTHGTCRTIDCLTPRVHLHPPVSTVFLRPKCKRSTVRLALAAFREFSPYNCLLTRTERRLQQLLVQSMRYALSEIFDVADPSGSMTMRSPTWVSGWHVPLLKLTKASIVPNRDDTHIHYIVSSMTFSPNYRKGQPPAWTSPRRSGCC